MQFMTAPQLKSLIIGLGTTNWYQIEGLGELIWKILEILGSFISKVRKIAKMPFMEQLNHCTKDTPQTTPQTTTQTKCLTAQSYLLT